MPAFYCGIAVFIDSRSCEIVSNGSDPTETSVQYTNPISVATTTTIKARAWKTGWTASGTVSSTYTITGTVSTPTFSPGGGTYTSGRTVTISCATLGATIRYTTNGSEPTTSSAQYTSPISVTTSMTLKAKAWKTNWIDSGTASATYTILETVATPTFNPGAGTYTSAQGVRISCATAGVTIRYTVDGTDPTEQSLYYSAPVTIYKSCTLKAKAWKTGSTPSGIASATYTILGTVTISGYAKAIVGNPQYPMVGLTIRRSDGYTTTTNSSGYYEFDVPYGWSGTIRPVPSNPKDVYQPSSRSFSNVTSDSTQNNFTYMGTPL